jgi:hypothetical protein
LSPGSVYRIALAPRAGQKVLSVRTVAGRDETNTTVMCADAHGVAREARSASRGSLLRHHARKRSWIIAAIEAPAVIVKILTHLGLPARAPPRSPARPLYLFHAA